ncbi:MAG: tetratricopeptide repeat protein, partial [Acidobacteria bacterium]|nr:tetratricopeptide repeat protein [Acidobacteriota bacterium]
LGTIYYQRQEYSAAEGYFRRALEQEPEAFEPLVNLGAALLALGRSQEALKINQKAQEIRPQDALANAQLGLNYFLVGNPEEAIPYLDRTKELDPAHFSNPQIPLARIYLQRSEEEAALRELEDFLNQHPDSPRADEVRATIEKLQDTTSSSEPPG